MVITAPQEAQNEDGFRVPGFTAMALVLAIHLAAQIFNPCCWIKGRRSTLSPTQIPILSPNVRLTQ
jgi:hypothetical protein